MMVSDSKCNMLIITNFPCYQIITATQNLLQSSIPVNAHGHITLQQMDQASEFTQKCHGYLHHGYQRSLQFLLNSESSLCNEIAKTSVLWKTIPLNVYHQNSTQNFSPYPLLTWTLMCQQNFTSLTEQEIMMKTKHDLVFSPAEKPIPNLTKNYT